MLGPHVRDVGFVGSLDWQPRVELAGAQTTPDHVIVNSQYLRRVHRGGFFRQRGRARDACNRTAMYLKHALSHSRLQAQYRYFEAVWPYCEVSVTTKAWRHVLLRGTIVTWRESKRRPYVLSAPIGLNGWAVDDRVDRVTRQNQAQTVAPASYGNIHCRNAVTWKIHPHTTLIQLEYYPRSCDMACAALIELYRHTIIFSQQT